MSNNGKLILVGSVILNILLIVSVSIFYIGKQDQPKKDWIAKKSSENQASDVNIHKVPSQKAVASKTDHKDTKIPQKVSQETEEQSSIVDYKSLINADTVDYFKHLSVMFPGVSSMDGHFDKIHDYLLSKYPKEKADALFETYKKYFKCETDLKYERVSWGVPKSADDWIEYINQTYNFRVNSMGKDIGPLLFGEEFKKLSFKLKKAKILDDDTLYGADKEKWIESLGMEVWGDKYQSTISGDVNSAFDVYKQKLSLYKKDFEDMNEEEKEAKIKEFRNELLSPELVKNLETAEKKTEEGKKRFESYQTEEQTILQNPDLDDEQRAEKINELQNETFKGNADAFRRGQALKQATQQAANKLLNK
ncbi:MAG: hypothetical protein HQK75_13555 [Candidatus Magnetomorum sp.]|nr:hypothetical protein [Candidatus Magnetomorum sp.]